MASSIPFRDTLSRLSSASSHSRQSGTSGFSRSFDGTEERLTFSDALLDLQPVAEDGSSTPAAGGSGGEGVPSLWARENLGLTAHYVCIGVVNGLVQNALQPYCQYVAKGDPNQCSTLATFVNLPWAYKVFYGLLSDAVPICGRHRKPYLVIGWGLTFAGSLAIALLGTSGAQLPLEVIASFFLAITFAYIIADCAADASLVAYSALEPASSRCEARTLELCGARVGL